MYGMAFSWRSLEQRKGRERDLSWQSSPAMKACWPERPQIDDRTRRLVMSMVVEA